jgi:iron complex outermembrane recepter protein
MKITRKMQPLTFGRGSRYGLIAALIGACSWAGSAFAQQANGATPAKDTLDEIVVTGTLIRSPSSAGVGSAVIAVDQKDLQATGANNVSEMLRDIPQVSSLGVSEASRTGTGGSTNITYANSINIRGLSPFATLTLLDGHRVPPGGTSGSTVDPDSWPSIMLQRVDIVADGASATYGSDAIAGVANLILRRNFEGVEASARYGWADSYNERKLGLLAGHHWATGQFTIGYENGYNSNLNGQDRSFFESDQTNRGGGNYSSFQCSPGTIVIGGVTYAIPAGGVTPANAGSLVPGTANRCDPAKYADILPQVERNTVALTADQQIGDYVSLFGDASYAKRTYTLKLQQALGPVQVPTTNAFFVAPPCAVLTPCSPAPGAPSCETVDYGFGNDAGNNAYNIGQSEYFEGTLGAKIDLTHGWRLTIDGTAGKDHERGTNPTHALNNGNLAAALASNDPTTALNVFGGSNSAAVINNILANRFYAPGDTSMQELEAKADGAIFPLPGGDVRMAVGTQWKHDELNYGFNSGIPGGADAMERQNLSRHSTSAFAEVLIPIFGAGNALPGVQSLDLDVAGRYEKYSDFGSTSHPKVGLNWKPIKELTVHASYGTSFRAPLLSELVGPLRGVFVQQYSDPLAASGTSTGYTLGGGNLGLQPETATTYSFGVDYEPTENAKISLTYFNIDYKNQISSYLADLTILQQTAQLGSLVTRCPSTACTALVNQYVGTLPVFGPILANPSVFVNGEEQNLGRTKTSGIDFQGSYLIPTASYGAFSVGLSGSLFTKYDVQFVPGGATFDELNTIGFPLKLRMRGSAGWEGGPLSVVGFINFENSYTNTQVTPNQGISPLTTFDIDVAYNVGKSWDSYLTRDLVATLHVNNLFDRDPPYVNLPIGVNGGGGFDPQAANPIGRLVSIQIAKKF